MKKTLKQKERNIKVKSPLKATASENCLNCVYFGYGGVVSIGKRAQIKWRGEGSICQHKKWKRISKPQLDKILKETRIRAGKTDNSDITGGYAGLFLQDSATREIFTDRKMEYSNTTILCADEKWLDLTAYKCERFYPESQRKDRQWKACWSDQQIATRDRIERNRFIITTIISVIVVAITAISLILQLRS